MILARLTPGENLFTSLESIARDHRMERGIILSAIARHQRHAEATRRAVRAWELEVLCLNPEEYSPSLTAVLMPKGHDSDALRKVILERFDLSLGTGLGKLKGQIFRVGHLGDFNDLMLAGTLRGVEMGLALASVPFSKGGVAAALDFLSSR